MRSEGILGRTKGIQIARLTTSLNIYAKQLSVLSLAKTDLTLSLLTLEPQKDKQTQSRLLPLSAQFI